MLLLDFRALAAVFVAILATAAMLLVPGLAAAAHVDGFNARECPIVQANRGVTCNAGYVLFSPNYKADTGKRYCGLASCFGPSTKCAGSCASSTRRCYTGTLSSTKDLCCRAPFAARDKCEKPARQSLKQPSRQQPASQPARQSVKQPSRQQPASQPARQQPASQPATTNLLLGSPPAPKLGQPVLVGIPGRIQYDNDNGFCGEVTLQMIMLEHGAWIPQETARSAGGGELLLGINYDKAMRKLGIAYEEFTGRNYKSFVAWAKKKLLARVPVVVVAYFRGGPDSDYDHIMPLVGIKTSTSAEYSDDDVLYVHSNYATEAVQRTVRDYVCTSGNKKDSITKGGCVPQNTSWGYAVTGPVYAGIGPRLELAVSSSKEPGMRRSVGMTGQLTIRGLQSGRKYAVHQIADLASVPKKGARSVAGAPMMTFTATGADKTVAVSFQSRTPAYFICVAQ